MEPMVGLFYQSNQRRNDFGFWWIEIKKQYLQWWVVEAYDAYYASPRMVRHDDLMAHTGGVFYKRVGIYNFERADAPWADCVRWAHRSPEAVGRALWRAEQKLSNIEDDNTIRAVVSELPIYHDSQEDAQRIIAAVKAAINGV